MNSTLIFSCRICGSDTKFLFETLVLNKYQAKYFRCNNCGFIQTEDPYWLSEAYNSPIGLVDVGLLQRNILLSDQVSVLLNQITTSGGTYLDYGGGYGVFVRLMRDKGYDFYLSELYADNLFAKYFELEDSKIKSGFSCLTAFEVFEHLVHPLKEIEKMFALSETIIFSTELQPNDRIQTVSEWWYFVPEAGQHISLYSLNSLKHLKKHFSCHFYTNGYNLHILSKIPLNHPFEKNAHKRNSISLKIKNKLFLKAKQNKDSNKRESFLMKDFDFYKTKLSDGKI